MFKLKKCQIQIKIQLLYSYDMHELPALIKYNILQYCNINWEQLKQQWVWGDSLQCRFSLQIQKHACNSLPL